MITCLFGTGTGRCGTMLLARILNCSSDVHCNHEHSICAAEMKRAFQRGKTEHLVRDSRRILLPTIREHNKRGQIYGEINSHLYLLYPELFRRYENTARFIALVRRPEDFVRSALARGFFSPDHPHPCEHVVPPSDTYMGEHWTQATAFEKCAWYWGMVNGFLYRFFQSIPRTLYRVVRTEFLDMATVRELYGFFGFTDFEVVEQQIRQLLNRRVNGSPGQSDTDEDVNTRSQVIEFGPMDSWTSEQLRVFERHVLPLRDVFYGTADGGSGRSGGSIIR